MMVLVNFGKLPDELWNYSFGKFLELFFYSTQPLFCHPCSHLMRDHVHCFCYKQMMVQIEYDAISILEVVVPPFSIRHDPVIRAALHDKVHFTSITTCCFFVVVVGIKSELNNRKWRSFATPQTRCMIS